MFVLIYIGLMMSSVGCRTIPAQPRASLSWSSLIVGGHDVDISRHPHQISLQTTGGAHVCGGAIIAHNRIVSAAHCTQNPSRLYRIRAGSSIWNSGGQLRRVSAIINHPLYCDSCPGYPNDISLVMLEKDLDFGDNVKSIQLAEMDEDFAGQRCTITGWGRIDSSQKLPKHLKGTEIDILTNTECEVKMKYIGNVDINRGHICLYDQRRRRGSCNGDSGGPLQCGDVLAGVTSWGISVAGSCRQDFPSIYSRVSLYKDWIEIQ